MPLFTDGELISPSLNLGSSYRMEDCFHIIMDIKSLCAHAYNNIIHTYKNVVIITSGVLVRSTFSFSFFSEVPFSNLVSFSFFRATFFIIILVLVN